LQFGDSIAHAAVDAEAEREVLARPCPVDDEIFGPLDDFFIAVAGVVPHHQLFPLADGLATDLRVLERGAAHAHHRRLPANDFGNHGLHQCGGLAQFAVLPGVFVERQQAAGHRIAGGVVAADDQQDQGAQEFLWAHLLK